jgi:DNA-binding LacI/PurR family transcriptional regulator
MTVSRVLQGRKDQVNDETYTRVLAAMHEMNYVPVRPAMQNRHVETNTIAIVPYYLKPARSLVDSLTFEGLCGQAGQNGYDLTIMLRGEAEWMANREELRFLDRRSDGFIFISPGCGEWQMAFEALIQYSIPTVVCYRRDVPEGIAWVDPDNESIIRQALDCLTRAGHSKIAYVAGPHLDHIDSDKLPNLSGARPSYDNMERQRYFTQIMQSLGHEEFSERIVWTKDPDWNFTREEFRDLLKSGVTGLICGDHQALQILDHAKALRLRIPHDFSIVGIDNQIEAAHRGLTSIGFGYDEIGRLAVQAWLELQQGNSARECNKVVTVRLEERATVAPPAKSALRRKN